MKRIFLKTFGFLIYFLTACAPFQDSIFSDQLLRHETNLNQLNINNVSDTDIEMDGKIRIAIIADSHQNYKPLDETINAINTTPQLDFVANLGDFSNSGYNLEYDQFLKSWSYLRIPRFTAIGNHDAIGAGPSLFRQAFGESNFWFESSSHRFVFFNSANLEDAENFKPQWLLDTVGTSKKPVIVFTHVALEDTERFSGAVLETFNTVIQTAQLIVNAHDHVYYLRSALGTPLLQAPRVEVGWLILEIESTNLKIIQMPTGEVTWVTLKEF